ncbi:MAG TPA: hypothetical protein PLK60_14745, partial [Myxococcota bacterium]|nr:hypothetical protein [Myxococcota bacterium]
MIHGVEDLRDGKGDEVTIETRASPGTNESPGNRVRYTRGFGLRRRFLGQWQKDALGLLVQL